jgi:hypothetical protein
LYLLAAQQAGCLQVGCKPLKWKPHRDEIAFQFIGGMDIQKPGQILRSKTHAKTY